MEIKVIEQALSNYEDLYAHMDIIRIDRDKHLQEIIPPEVKKAMDDIHAEYDPQLVMGEETLEVLKKELQELIKTTPEGFGLKGQLFTLQRSRTGRTADVDGILKVCSEMANNGDPVLLGFSIAIQALISEAKPVGKVVRGGKK